MDRKVLSFQENPQRCDIIWREMCFSKVDKKALILKKSRIRKAFN